MANINGTKLLMELGNGESFDLPSYSEEELSNAASKESGNLDKWEYYMKRGGTLYFRNPMRGKIMLRGVELPNQVKYGTLLDIEFELLDKDKPNHPEGCINFSGINLDLPE